MEFSSTKLNLTSAMTDNLYGDDWVREAACRNDDDPTMYDNDSNSVTPPPTIMCNQCTVINDCLLYALHHDEHGIWGGTTDIERNAIKSRIAGNYMPVVVPTPHDSNNADADAFTANNTSCVDVGAEISADVSSRAIDVNEAKIVCFGCGGTDVYTMNYREHCGDCGASWIA